MLLLLPFAASCQASVTPQPSSSPAQPSCPTRLTGEEIHGHTPAGVELWALIFGHYPIARATETKIVWRMTGAGNLQLHASGPDNQQLAPRWGPEAHASSNWHRPGDEWGAGFIFPTAGCWTIHASRGPRTGTVDVLVTNRSASKP
jgi:hypothetical protein